MTKRVALVTGGMGGIGTAVCRRLARMNDNVVVANCLPGYEKKDEWLARQRADGYDNIFAAEGDVSDFESAAEMVHKIESDVGPVDILVNSAGIVRDNMLKKMSLSDWLAVISTNLNSAFIVTKQVIDGMCERGWGRVINLSSVKGKVLREAFRVLKPGGHFHHCDMLRPRSRFVEKTYYAYLRMCLAVTGLLFRSGPAALNCKNYFIHALEMFYSAEELSVVLRELGYVDVTAKTVFYGMLGFHRAVKPQPG